MRGPNFKKKKNLNPWHTWVDIRLGCTVRKALNCQVMRHTSICSLLNYEGLTKYSKVPPSFFCITSGADLNTRLLQLQELQTCCSPTRSPQVEAHPISLLTRVVPKHTHLHLSSPLQTDLVQMDVRQSPVDIQLSWRTKIEKSAQVNYNWTGWSQRSNTNDKV